MHKWWQQHIAENASVPKKGKKKTPGTDVPQYSQAYLMRVKNIPLFFDFCRTQSKTHDEELIGSLAQMRVKQGMTMSPGPQPSPCPEIRLACYLKPPSVGNGVGGGKTPSQSQTAVTLGKEVKKKRRGEEQLFYQWPWLQIPCTVPDSLVPHTLLKCPYIGQPIRLNKDL